MRQDFEDLMLSLSLAGENGEEEQIVPLVDGQDSSQTQQLKTGDAGKSRPIPTVLLHKAVSGICSRIIIRCFPVFPA